jgi:membrane associated rhomboid family serine protease
MNEWLNQIQWIFTQSKENLLFALFWVGIVWLVYFCNKILNQRLNHFGIYPRNLRGLPGIAFSPFLHGNFKHLFFNSIPLFILMELVLLYGRQNFYLISLWIIACSGLLVWLFGRKAIHIGASSLIMGYWGFILVNAYYHHNVIAIFSAILCLFYFWGLFINLFPVDIKSSWEGHVFGFIAGVSIVFLGPL